MAKASKIPVAVMNNLPAAVSIQRPCYAMATTDGQSADITMYGEIVEEQPVDWETGEPIPGQYIIESEFLDDLNRISGCDNIIIHMDSLGGNAGVSILVHNKLRDLAAKGAKLTCIVDGVAMSGGSLIMCACDTVKVNPSSLVMIHNAKLSADDQQEYRNVLTLLCDLIPDLAGYIDTTTGKIQGGTTALRG